MVFFLSFPQKKKKMKIVLKKEKKNLALLKTNGPFATCPFHMKAL